MSEKSKVTNSRKTVICDFCGDGYEQRHLKDHTSRVHKGKKPTIRPDKSQSTLQFCRPREKRPSESEENTNEKAKVARTEEPEKNGDEVELEELVFNAEEVKEEHVTNEDIMEQIKQSTKTLLETMETMNEMKDKKEKKEIEDSNTEDLGHLLNEARTFAEIESSVSELTYKEDEQVITCDLCYDRTNIGEFKLGGQGQEGWTLALCY